MLTVIFYYMLNILALGMGVQSVALYYMASVGLLPRVDYAIFADPGRELSVTYEYLAYLQAWQNTNSGIPIIVKNDRNLFNDLLNNTNSNGHRFASIPAFVLGQDGKEGMLLRQCTREYKIQVIDNAIRDLYGLKAGARKPKTRIWKGISIEEVERMSRPTERWKIHCYPFCQYWFSKSEWGRIDWGKLMSRSDIISWYGQMGLPVPEKSGCVFCPYRSDGSWAEMKMKFPNDFESAVQVDHAIRDCTLKGIHQPSFLHRSLRPLDQVNFDSKETLWSIECSGNCGV